MRTMSQRLGRWVTYGALLSGCSTWVDLETPMPPTALAGGTAGDAGTAGAVAPSDRAGSGAGSGGGGGGRPGGGAAGGKSSTEGGISSAGGGTKNDPEPGLFEPLDP